MSSFPAVFRTGVAKLKRRRVFRVALVYTAMAWLVTQVAATMFPHLHLPTHSGEWLGVPATGRKVSMTGVDLFRVVDGRIEQVRIQADYRGALQQIGAIPRR